MRLNIISQIIEHYHEFVKNHSGDPRYDFPEDINEGELQDPIGGDDSITEYDEYNLDQDFYNNIQPE